MPSELKISLSYEPLDEGSAEEKATFGMLSMTANGRLLTVVEDIERVEIGPCVAGYPLAEWLLWNWWRLRWEFGRRPSGEDAALDWDSTHCMSAVGDSYVWPNIAIFSDGPMSFLISEPSQEPYAASFRYVGSPRREAVPAASLESAIDDFAKNILACLDERKLKSTNLHRLWNDLTVERREPELARFRRLEAQFGYDPDKVDECLIRQHLAGADELGEEAWGEVAADAALRGRALDDMVSAQDITETAKRNGFDADPKDAVTLPDGTELPSAPNGETWRVGYGMAQAVRDREGLDGLPITDARLAALSGTTAKAIERTSKRWNGPCFALDRPGGGRLALRSKWKTGRRFELARLLCDRLFAARSGRPTEALHPATRTCSYRQKVQRAFAAELLSPFAAVDDMMAGDLSEDRQIETARRFGVSQMTVRSQLVNHGRLDRENAPDIAARGSGL